MVRALSWLARHLGLAVFALSCAGVAGYAFLYLYAEFQPHNPFHRSLAAAGWAVPMHFFGAGLALLLAPLQVSGRLRRRWPRVHRVCGGVYVLAVAIGGVGGLLLSLRTQGGWPTGVGFALLAIVWMATTAQALGDAVRRRFEAHERWMLRSIALTYSAVTLRLMLPLGMGVLGWSFATTYLVAAWTCWTLNGVVMELYLWRRTRARRGAPALTGARSLSPGIGSASRPAAA